MQLRETDESGHEFFEVVRPPSTATADLYDPPPPSIREWFYASIVSTDSHCSESLFAALTSCATDWTMVADRQLSVAPRSIFMHVFVGELP
jgi:hypothetical protein